MFCLGNRSNGKKVIVKGSSWEFEKGLFFSLYRKETNKEREEKEEEEEQEASFRMAEGW